MAALERIDDVCVESIAVRHAIDRCAPARVVCGHIHDSAGQFATVGQTPVANAGPDGILWDVDRPQKTSS